MTVGELLSRAEWWVVQNDMTREAAGGGDAEIADIGMWTLAFAKQKEICSRGIGVRKASGVGRNVL